MEKEQLIALGLTSEQADKVLGAHKTGCLSNSVDKKV